METKEMTGTPFSVLIEKAIKIVGKKEYDEICSKYKWHARDKCPQGVHTAMINRAKKLFEEAIEANADDIDLTNIAVYFMMCIDMVKHDLAIGQFIADHGIESLEKIYIRKDKRQVITDIKVYKNGKLETEFSDCGKYNFAIMDELNGSPVDVTLHFTCDNIKKYSENQPWTGKVVCCANRGTCQYTPGMVYSITDGFIHNDTARPYIRGNHPDYVFSKGTFTALQNDFLRQGIDIIEFKGEA